MRHRNLRTAEIGMHVVEEGEGPPVVLCHGFPELWYSWRHQLPALAAAGYRAIAPDQRGYGRTDRPPRVEDYDIVHLTGDLVALLDDMGAERAVFVGHDWGAIVCWQMAQLHPDRVRAVVGMSVPFLPRASRPPTQAWREAFGDLFFYMLYFQEPGVADAELAQDPRTTLRRILYTASADIPQRVPRIVPARGTGFLDVLDEPPSSSDWLTGEDLDYYVAEFERTGFTGGLNWYRNFDRNWELTRSYESTDVAAPALFVSGERDPVLLMWPPDGMERHVPNLREKVIVPGAGHWVQQERPEEVNRALLRFLETV